MKPGKMIKASSIPWVVIVLAFVLLYAAYFLLYIPQQQSLVEKRAFRILKEYAGNMQDKLEYYESHLKNYSPYYSIEFLSKKNDTGFNADIDQAIKKSQQVETLIANLNKTITTTFCHECPLKKIVFDEGQYKISFGGATESEVAKVLERFIPGFLENEMRDKIHHSFEHKIPVTTLMENLKFDKLLENISLFNDTAAVYNTSLQVIQDITNPGILADTLHKLQGGLIAKINIRGEDNHVMVLPFTFLGSRLYLAGFISASEFRHKTRDINNQFLITLAGVLLLLLFGMPILKIVFISPREQLRAIDATASSISLIFGIGFLILIVLSVMKQFVVDRQNLRVRINDISETLCKNVDNDFGTIKQLYEDITSDEKNPASNKALVRTIQNIFKEKYFLDQLFSIIKYESVNIGKIPDEYMKKEFPLNEVFLIDEDGMLKKIVSRTGATSLVPVDLSHRNYFKTMTKKSKECWFYKTTSGSNQPYFIESLKSYNSGEKEVAFSFRLENEIGKRFGANILAITSPMPSLFKQILPEDVNFLIINNAGDVLFHSDQSKNLHENFLNECDVNVRLIGAMHHRVADIVRVNYNEKDWLAKIVPIRDAPLFHITLIDYGFKHDKNARILFYTFYFMIATFIIILAGMGIMYISKPAKTTTSEEPWLFNWLLFHPEKHKTYVFLLIIQSILFILQFAGLILNDKPVSMFVYQTIFITFSAYAAFIIIGNKKVNRSGKTFSMMASPQFFFFIIMLIFTLIFILFHQNHLLLYPVAVVIMMSFLLIPSARKFLEKRPVQDSSTQEFEAMNHLLIDNKKSISGKHIFHLYVFLWLLSISAVPPIQYYHSVKMQEEILWKRDILEYVAIKNLELDDEYTDEMRSEDWYKKIAGNNIDFLKISHESCPAYAEGEEKPTTANWFYTLLPDPVTKSNHLIGLLNNASYHHEWQREIFEKGAGRRMVNDNVLCYSKPEKEGQIKVEKAGSYSLSAVEWLLYFSVPIILVVVLLWFIFSYVAKIVLGTIILDWKLPKEQSWTNLLNETKQKRILLISLNSEEYMKITRDILIKKTETDFLSKMKVLTASSLPKYEVAGEIKILPPTGIIWITGLGEIIKEPNKVTDSINVLSSMSNRLNCRLVVEIPFGFDFIREYYDQLLYENTSDKMETSVIRLAYIRLEAFFRDLYKFTGSLNPEVKITVSDTTGSADASQPQGKEIATDTFYGHEPRYHYIWNNMTNQEKLILTDLSIDGMLNFKNKQIINQLKSKGLLTFTPNPHIYSDGFGNFLTEVVDPDETRELQMQMGRQGNWHNLRYLILLTLIPLLIFIFIAQGTSVEKVIAISTGGMAVLSGIMRLFESDIFRQATKMK